MREDHANAKDRKHDSPKRRVRFCIEKCSSIVARKWHAKVLYELNSSNPTTVNHNATQVDIALVGNIAQGDEAGEKRNMNLPENENASTSEPHK